MILKNKNFIVSTFTFLSMIGILIVISILNNTNKEQLKQSQQLIAQEATAHYQTIKDLEIWHNKLGGVFKKTVSKNDYKFEIYSLNPKNIENKAIGFNKEALEYFSYNKDQNTYYKFSEDKETFNFMGVLTTEERCIQCHQDFTVGDIRGGINVKIPLSNYLESVKTTNEQFNTFYLMVFAFFLIGMFVIIYFINLLYKEKENVEKLNNTLEQKVEERTEEIKRLFSREHYLKDLLETVSDLNESLISSYSVSSIIKSSFETLQHHPNYKLIIFSHYDGEDLFIRYIFGDIYNSINKEVYSLKELEANSILKGIYSAIVQKATILNDEIIQTNIERHQRDDDYILKESVSFPLIEKIDDNSFDVIAIFTDRDLGFDREELSILSNVSKDIMMALSSHKQRQMTEKLQKDQMINYEETILAFVDMIEQRDAYTAGHTLRVAKYSRILAKALNFKEENIRKIEKAAILHDIGKIATPDTILLKPGRLNILEYDLIKNHVSAGYKMLSKVKMYQELAEIIKYHHERFDGKGYPNAIKGDDIPLEGHILIAADAFDAMTTNRIYKPRLTVSKALEELKKNKSTQFHPDVVDVAMESLKDIELSQTTQIPQTDLEKQRFSYFFNDTLTNAYNEAYLYLALSQMKKNLYISIVKLRNFNEFNKKNSWKIGNKVLISIVSQLIEKYPFSKVFRIEGDDFLLISEVELKIDEESFSINDLDKTRLIQKEIRNFTVDGEKEYFKFEEFFEKD